MKVAVLFRGPLRPTAALSRGYIAALMRNFDGIDIKPARFLATWHLNFIDEDAKALFEHDVDNVITVSMPPADLIGSALYDAYLPSGHRVRNIFYQHYVSKMAIQTIVSHDNYDVIVHARTDMEIDFGNEFPLWFAHDRLESFQALHIRDIYPESFLNDQFCVAPPQLMLDAWDYGTFERLRERIAQVLAVGGKAEDVLQSIVDDAGIVPIGGPVRTYWLDADRHKAVP